MAKLYFNYGTMCSGKSSSIIGIVSNYNRQNKETLVFSYKYDSRFNNNGAVANRDGSILLNTINFDENFNFYNFYQNYKDNVDKKISCILIDESQFLSKEQVLQLADLTATEDIPVMCFGLKSDYMGDLFTGSYYLLIYADKITEHKTVCSMENCNNKATMNARFSDGIFICSGKQMIIGDLEYKPICKNCYLKLKKNLVHTKINTND